MSLYKVDVPPLVDGGAAGSAGSSRPDEEMGNVITWSGNATKLIPVLSAEEMLLLHRLQPEVQRQNNWLESRIVALQAENERLRDELRQSSIDITRAEIERLRKENEKLRAALLRIRETKVFLGAIAQEMMDDALRREDKV